MARPRRALWPGLAVLATGVAAAAGLWVEVARHNRELEQARFAALAKKTSAQLATRLGVYGYGLRGARGAVVAAGDALDWAAFHAYAQSRDIAKEFPGATGFGFIRRVGASDEAAFLDSMRRDGRPDFALSPPRPNRSERFVITYIEPEAANQAAIGFDVASDSARSEAAVAAARSGAATLTSPLSLRRRGSPGRLGFLVLLPVYRADLPSNGPDERWQAVRGWAYAPLDLNEVMAGFDLFDDNISLTLRDRAATAEPFFQSQAAQRPAAHDLLTRIALPLYGRVWELELRARPSFVRALNLSSPRQLAAGVLFSTALLAVLLSLYLTGRQRRLAGLLEHARLAAIVANANDAIIGKTLKGTVTSWNKAAERIFGYSAEEAIGKPLAQLIMPRDRQHEEVSILSAIGRGEPLPRFNARRLRRDGATIEVSVSVSPIIVDGRVVGAATVVQDITELQRLQRQLHSTLDRLQMAVDAAEIGVWVWELADNRLTWDTHMCELYGVPRELSEDPQLPVLWRSRIHPEDRDLVERKLREHIAGNDIYDPVFRIVVADGSLRHVQAAAIVERDNAGKVLRMIGIDRDVTVQKTSEARIMQLNASLEDQVCARTAELHRAVKVAQDANRSKSEFLANMSHEIRTPLNAILGLSYLLQKQALSPTTRGMVNNIASAGRSLLSIINDILDFSKIEARRLQIESVPFRLSEVLATLAGILAAANPSKDTEVIVGPPPEGCDRLKGDGTRLGQVLINLAGNAIKFTARGEVVVTTSLVERSPNAEAPEQVRLRFSIRDTGIGIPLEKQRSIFEAFTQADSSTVRRFGGTGLGLTISKSLVALLGGELHLKSEPGVGSEFTFELPFAISDPGQVSLPAMAHQHVLVVDDHELALQTLAETAKSLGWDTHAVNSGETAVDIMTGPQASCYNVVLLDWHMPGLDGLQAAVQIRQRCSDTLHSPIIIMVSSSERESLLSQPDSGAVDGILTKPVTSSSLYDAVLNAKQSRDQLLPCYAQALGERLREVRALVVDDSEINREVALNILAGEGARVEVACDGLSAVELLSARPHDFDIVLMDIQMPTLDGYAATRRIRSMSALRDLPIVALTAGAFRQQHQEALDSGMTDFVAKPFDVDQLISVIARLTGRAADLRREPGDAPLQPPQPVASEQVIDVALGLKNWREESKHRAQLERFLQLHGGDEQQLARLLEAGDEAAARASLHKLAGAAGAVALTQVASIARDMERDAPGLDRLWAQLGSLSAALRRAAHAIEAARPREPIELPVVHTDLQTKTIVPANDNERRERASQLMAALDSDDPTQIEPLLPIVPSLLPEPKARQFLERISAYDFRGAEAILLAEAG